LRALYEKSGKSLRQLEHVTYISDSTIHRYLTRKTLPPWPVLECLVAALDGQKLEFRLLWERAQTDHCTPGSRQDGAEQLAGPGPLTPAAMPAWMDALSAVVENCSDELIMRLAETIIALTPLIDQASSAEAAASLRAARATCWMEIAGRVGMSTPSAQLCAAACRQAGQLDRANNALDHTPARS
jgi:lambda repressor-like predicted transcriptional regulator